MKGYNNYSGGIPSTAQAIVTGKKNCNVIVNTGDNMKEAWVNSWTLRKAGYKVLCISSMLREYPTYFEYVEGEGLKPFYVSCSDRAKQRHLNYFYNRIGPVIVNVGLTYDKKDIERAEDFKDTRNMFYKFPLIENKITRAQCYDIVEESGLNIIAVKTGCVRCPKQGPEGSTWDQVPEGWK